MGFCACVCVIHGWVRVSIMGKNQLQLVEEEEEVSDTHLHLRRPVMYVSCTSIHFHS